MNLLVNAAQSISGGGTIWVRTSEVPDGVRIEIHNEGPTLTTGRLSARVLGAGSAALAAATQEKTRISGRKVAVVATGGNVDQDVFAEVLSHH